MDVIYSGSEHFSLLVYVSRILGRTRCHRTPFLWISVLQKTLLLKQAHLKHLSMHFILQQNLNSTKGVSASEKSGNYLNLHLLTSAKLTIAQLIPRHAYFSKSCAVTARNVLPNGSVQAKVMQIIRKAVGNTFRELIR